MITPCRECLVRANCRTTCDPSMDFLNDISNEIDKNARFIFSKNKIRRKYIPENKIQHWNALVIKYNEHIKYYNQRLDRLHEPKD